jgi:hypothetical protein
MKIKVMMKDPDTLGDAIDDAVRTDLAGIEGLDAEDREALFEGRREKVGELCAKWFKYGEYLSIEIDTDAETATVLTAL